jgi:membrane protein
MYRRITRRLRTSRTGDIMVTFAKRIVLPGFQGVPFFYVMKFFRRGLQKGALQTRASALAFHFFLALFPSVIFLFTLIPYIPITHFQEQLLSVIQAFMPQSAFEATKSTIVDIVKHQRGGLLSVGFIAALYFSTNGFHTMMTAFNRSYHVAETRTWLKQRLVAILLVLIVTVLVIAAIAFIIITEILLNKAIFMGDAVQYIILAGRIASIFALFFCTISFMYYLGPAKKKRWRFINAGSTFATVLSILTSYGFAYYVNNFGQYNKIYGSIGTLIVILLWVYFNSFVLLLGFELNASIANAKENHKIPAIVPQPASEEV